MSKFFHVVLADYRYTLGDSYKQLHDITGNSHTQNVLQGGIYAHASHYLSRGFCL